MRIFIVALVAPVFSAFFPLAASAALDQERLRNEIEYLRNNAFLGDKTDSAREEIKRSYFDRSKSGNDDLPEDVADLDKMYFQDSVSTGFASPERDQAKE